MPIMDGEANPDANQGLENQNSDGSTETEMPQWAIDMQKGVEELTGHVRNLQSGKDKGINNIQKQVDSQSDTFAQALEIAKKYDDPAEAQRVWWIEQQMKAEQQAQNLGGDNANAQQNQSLAGQSSDAELVDPELLKTLDVDPASAEYLNQVSLGKVGNEAALAVLAARNTQQQQEGAATGASGGTGSSGTTQPAQQVLRDQYNEALDKAQKEAGGVLLPLALYGIQEEFTKKGLEGLGYS